MVKENQDNLSVEEAEQLLFEEKENTKKKICTLTLKENKLSEFSTLLIQKRNGKSNLFVTKGMEERKGLIWHLNITTANRPTNTIS